MNFSDVLQGLKDGRSFRRKIWPGTVRRISLAYPGGDNNITSAYIFADYSNGFSKVRNEEITVTRPWDITCDSLLAIDWEEVLDDDLGPLMSWDDAFKYMYEEGGLIARRGWKRGGSHLFMMYPGRIALRIVDRKGDSSSLSDHDVGFYKGQSDWVAYRGWE